MQEISFNFDGKNPKKINGDIRYQIDTISLLKKNKFKIFLGYKNVTFFFSLCLRCFGLILIKIPILSQIFNKKLNYLSRQKYLDFKKPIIAPISLIEDNFFSSIIFFIISVTSS